MSVTLNLIANSIHRMRKILEKKPKRDQRLSGKELSKMITALSAGLVYISEIDSEVVSVLELKNDSNNIKELHNILKQDLESGEADFTDFRIRLTARKDWHLERHKKTRNGFEQLFKFLDEQLDDLRLVRIGEVRVGLFVVGYDIEKQLQGIYIEAFET